MATRHLFFTFRMIWNHFMPFECKILPYRHYDYFTAFYTKEYLKEAVVEVGRELFARNDIRPEWRRDLEKMRGYMKGYPAFDQITQAKKGLK